jgi:hypothetical protein
VRLRHPGNFKGRDVCRPIERRRCALSLSDPARNAQHGFGPGCSGPNDHHASSFIFAARLGIRQPHDRSPFVSGRWLTLTPRVIVSSVDQFSDLRDETRSCVRQALGLRTRLSGPRSFSRALLTRRVPAFAPQLGLSAFLLAVLAAVLAVFPALRHRAVTRRMRAFLSVCHGMLPGESLCPAAPTSKRVPSHVGCLFGAAKRFRPLSLGSETSSCLCTGLALESIPRTMQSARSGSRVCLLTSREGGPPQYFPAIMRRAATSPWHRTQFRFVTTPITRKRFWMPRDPLAGGPRGRQA